MTCIAAIEDGERAWLASDTGITAGDGDKDNAPGKIWVHPSGIAFGIAGNVSAAQAVRYGMVVPKLAPKVDGIEWCVRKLVPAIKRALAKSQYDDDGAISIQILVAVHGCVYEIDPYLAVTRSPRGYSAIGSGSAYAFGSLFSTKKQKPQTRVRMAVEAACKHHAGCALPLEVICVP